MKQTKENVLPILFSISAIIAVSAVLFFALKTKRNEIRLETKGEDTASTTRSDSPDSNKAPTQLVLVDDFRSPMEKEKAMAPYQPLGWEGSSKNGGRLRSDILRTLRTNYPSLRYLYNKRVEDTPGLTGAITVRFSVDSNGKILFCLMVSSTLGDSQLENEIVRKISSWKFCTIDTPGDVTEVIYPFHFSSDSSTF